jgi:hypothetical protein
MASSQRVSPYSRDLVQATGCGSGGGYLSRLTSVRSNTRESMSILFRLLKPEKDTLSLLWDFHSSECERPGDRIRALYGLAGFSSHALEEMGIDGELGWPALYAHLTWHSIRQNQGWQVLSHLIAFGSLHKREDDWLRGCQTGLRKKSGGSYLERILCQQQLSEVEISKNGDGETMELHGFLCEKVSMESGLHLDGISNRRNSSHKQTLR